MEEVDKILIHALKQVGTEVPEEVDSVRLFSSELVVEAVVSCLRVIDPGVGQGLPASLPPGMSARFRVGMSLAQACQDVGYKGELGYQTFLYSSEPEIRSLLMFLVEKLPRGSAESSDQSTGKSVLLHKGIAGAMRAELSVPWLPVTCRLPRDSPTQVPDVLHHFHTQDLSPAQSPAGTSLCKEEREYQREHLPPVTCQLSHHASVLSSLLERHTAESSAAHDWNHEWNSQGLLSRLTPQEYRQRKRCRLRLRLEEQLRSAAQTSSDSGSHSSSDLSDLLQTFRSSNTQTLTKGSHFTHTQKFTFTQEAVAPCPLPQTLPSEGNTQLQQQEELSSLQQQLQQMTSDLEQLSTDLKHKSVTTAQVLNDINKRERENETKRDQIQVKKKTMDLLPQAEENLHKIQALVETSAKRVLSLAAQWEKHRAPLIEENRRLKEICRVQDMESSGKLSEIRSLHDKITVCTEEAKKKEETYKQLVSELESLPQDVSRSAYTQRILEIVSNIKKQKEEIFKILSDTKELQKEINNLTGKLDRTFAVTDELIFKDAKKDESVRKSYKHLAALHENCNQLIQTIEDTGSILREIRDLEEQIESEHGNKTVANLERILEDYKAIRQENAALAAKVSV
ncbi:LOW QUALITY PROTEIN: coiled-coil domain-containing protein 22 [Boleophthalmus pectinirostris]|uniref:LOW QUALITY PROTEIN: coiled-coil domain-containing protein 22 n=1 Tax=Boleophthalmus pectinirostris TaxID=150288 RepID=UPI0024320CF5|nr:LOW QUALITY PROTEIN: coiled-coil domain-containing protein 22 [Boleophthalmus pectinirostris]